MFRALCIKEWTQLALLRWVGFGLGLLLPLLLLGVTTLAAQGWLPFGPRPETTAADLLGAPLHALGFGLWGLLALMVGSQVFAADRGAGTDGFLLERPVSRRTVWSAKVLTGLAAVALLVLAHTGYGWALTTFAGGTFPPVKIALLGVLPLLLLAFGAGAAAAALVRAPLQALLIGLLLALLPLGVAALLTRAFPFAYVGSAALGVVAPALLIPAWIVISWIAETRGEPAGRGRWRRTLIAIGVALAVVLGLFAVAHPVALRVGASGPGTVRLSPDPDRRYAVRGTYRGGYLIDLKTGDRRFLPPPFLASAWSADGRWLAVADEAGIGARTTRIRFLDPTGSIDGASAEIEGFRYRGLFLWSDGRLMVGSASGIDVLDPRRGRTGRLATGVSPLDLAAVELGGAMALLLPCDDAACRALAESGAALERPDRPLPRMGAFEFAPYGLHTVDLDTPRIAARPERRLLLLRGSRAGLVGEQRGTVWVEPTGEGRWRAIDLQSGEVVTGHRGTLKGEAFNGVHAAHVVETDGGRRLEIVEQATGRTVADHDVGDRRVWARWSPDARYLLLQDSSWEDDKIVDRRYWLFDGETAELREVAVPEFEDAVWIYWESESVLQTEHEGDSILYDVRDGTVRTIDG